MNTKNTRLKALKSFIGNTYKFKMGWVPVIGTFRGIGCADGNWGLIFSVKQICDRKAPASIDIVIHPKMTKCSDPSDSFIHLRRTARAIFDELDLHNNSQRLFYSHYNVMEIKE